MVLNRRLFFVCILMAILMAAPASASEAPASDYVRLHVVASDDTVSAQALKLRVRDAVLAAARRLLSDCDGADEAWRRVNAHLDALSAAATARARAQGWTGPVRCETGVFDFPDRRYGDTLVPAGKYRALRVVVGEGRGHNWWCVLYPTLCRTGDGGFYSSVWNWLQRWLGGEPS